jgi:sec-independent protein translocase protein TatC
MLPERTENPTRVLTFTDHLQELRVRIIICLVFFALTLIGGFMVAPRIVEFLIKPLVTIPHKEEKPSLQLRLQPDGQVTWGILAADAQTSDPGKSLPVTTNTLSQLSTDYVRIERPFNLAPIEIGHRAKTSLFYLTPLEPFFLWLQGALLVSAVFTIPMVIYQLWLFVSPGLVRRERRVIAPLLGFSVILFPLGAYVAYLLMQICLEFLLAFGNAIPGLEPNLVASRYLSFAMVIMGIFGLTFEFPIFLVLLSRLGIVNSAMLVAKRRIAIVLITVVSAFAVPSPDPFSMIAMLIPLLLLYEVAIWIIRLLEKAREAEDAAPAQDSV